MAKLMQYSLFLLAVLMSRASAFTTITTATTFVARSSSLHNMMDPSTVEAITTSAAAAGAVTSSALVLAETEAWVQPAATFLDPFLNIMSFAMLCRVVLSWYPENNINEMPWLLIAVPTQGLMRAVRGFVPPAFGVDITPIFWLAIFTFIHEILLGQQGLLTLKLKYGI